MNRNWETLLYDERDGVSTITLNRPDRKNAIDMRMLAEVYELLTEISYSTGIRVVILTGAGRFFCPGGDIQAIASGEMDEQMAQGYNRVIYRVPVVLHEMPQLSIAKVNGACAGAGLGWALGCDVRVAGESAMFNTAFLDRGIAGDMAVPWSLPRIVGPAQARKLSFFPGKFGTEEALRLGIVTDVFPDGSLDEEVDRMTARLMTVSPTALRKLKLNYVAAERLSFSDYSDFETGGAVRTVPGPSVNREGFASYLEKRPSALQAG